MEVPYVQGPGNPLKRDEALEAERFSKEFEDLQKKISSSDEKERSRKRQQQEYTEEMKRKSTTAVHEQRSVAPSPVHDAKFTKVLSKHTPHAIPSSKASASVSSSAKSSLEFAKAEKEEREEEVEKTEKPSSIHEPSKVFTSSEAAKEAAAKPSHTSATAVAKAEAKQMAPVTQESQQAMELALEKAIAITPTIEQKLGKEGEVEQATFTPEKNLSNITAMTAPSGLNPYTRLTPEMMEMFDNMILHMQVMEESDIRETTFFLGGKAFENSPLNGSRIIIREYQKSAPMQYNIEFEGTPEAVEKIAKKMDALTLALTHGNYSFKVHRFETRISTKNLSRESFLQDEELS